MPVVRPLIAIAALSLSACSEDMLSFPGASTVDDCRAAHENARMGNNINGGGSLGRQTSGFCPPKVSVLYGGTSYCVRQ